MLDPASIGGFDNLSLYQLVKIAKLFFPEKEEMIKKEIEGIKIDAKVILNARKKIIAHRDLKIAINKDNLGETKFSEIESIISSVSKVINKAMELLGEPNHSFVWMTDRYGSMSLIRALKESNYYRDLKQKLKLFAEIRKIESENKFHKL